MIQKGSSDETKKVDATNIVPDASVTPAKIADGAVTSPKLTNTISFHAYRNTALNTSATANSLAADAEVYDTGNNYNTSTGKFIAPLAGIYHFDGRFGLGSGDRRASAFIYVNGSLKLSGVSVVNTFAASNVSGTIKLAANDEVECYIQSDTTVALIITSPATSYFTGHFVGVA